MSPAGRVVLLALVGSLIVNGVVATRFREERARSDRLERQLAQQSDQLDALRGDLRSGDDPLEAISRAVAQIRRLRFLRAVTPELLSASALRERIEDAFLDQNDRGDLTRSQKVLAALGLISPSTDLYDTIRTVQQDQVAGFYDSEDGRLVVGASDANTPSAFDKVVLAHEYTHAVTDQHFDLGRLDKLQDDKQEDASTAFLALIEGDAQLVMSIYRDQVLTDDERAAMIRDALGTDQSSFDALPPFLQRAFEFPYTAGLTFVQSLYDQGGFTLVDQAYKDPPVSTEQIMHPERFSAARPDVPVEVSLPNLARAMGEGWRSLERGDIGELDLKLLADDSLGRNLGTGEAARAADGWDGGRYAAASSGDDVVVALLTAWDDVGQAREATDSFAEWLRGRYPNGASFDAGGNATGWGDRTGAGIVSRADDRMVLIVAPDPDAAMRAKAAFAGF